MPHSTPTSSPKRSPMPAGWAARCAAWVWNGASSPAAGQNGLGQPHRLRAQSHQPHREGATNRSVAQQLHLSPHTVKTHVHNAFAKLGITSRAQLTQLMRRSDDQSVKYQGC